MNENNFKVHLHVQNMSNSVKILLLLLFLYPISHIEAATEGTFGDLTCSVTSSDECVGGTYDETGTLSYDPAGNYLEFTSPKTGSAYIKTLNVKDTYMRSADGNNFSGSGIKSANFKNASFKGGYLSYGDQLPGESTNMSFEGHYSKTGYAFEGNIRNYNGNTILTFTNGANVKGNLVAGIGRDRTGINKADFVNSSMEGDIINEIYSVGTVTSNDTIRGRVAQNITFSGNSDKGNSDKGNSDKGFALKGNIKTSLGLMYVSFSDGAKMIGNVVMTENGTITPATGAPYPADKPSTKLTFINSSITGDITQSNTGKREITFSGNQATDNYAMKGTVTNNGGKLTLTLDGGALWQGGDDGIAFNNSGSTTININPNSAISGDFNNTEKGTLNLTFNSSTHSGTFNLDGGTTIIKTSNKSSIGNFSGGGLLTLNLDGSSAGNIKNSNTSSTITFSDTLPPPPDSSSNLRIGEIDFSGKLTGDIKYYTIGSIDNHNQNTTDISITSSKVGNIQNVNKLTISASSTGDITNADSTASLILNSMSGQSVGNISFAGTLNAVFDKTISKDIAINGGSATLNLSNGTEVGSLSTASGNTTINLDNSNINGSLNNGGTLNAEFKNKSLLKGDLVVSGGDSVVSFENGTSILGAIVGVGGTSNTTFSSDVTKISFESFSDLFPTSGSGVLDLSTMSSEEKQALISKITPEMLMLYLNASGISNYGQNINTHGGTNKVDFEDSLYLGGAVNTDGGTSNVTLSFSDALIAKLKDNDLTKAFLYDGSGPEFFVNTYNGTSNIALSGNIKGIAHFNYKGGNTNIVFSDTVKKDTATTASKTIGDTTDFNNITSFDPTSSDLSKREVKVNGYTFEDGLLIRLDAQKADSILSSYRDIFGSNSTTFHIDKITDNATYVAKISGVLVGEVNSLSSSSSTSAKNYEAILDENAAFIGNLNIADRNVSIELSKGSKLILSANSNITKLSSNEDNTPNFIDLSNIIGDTLNQKNTVIDLATQGIPSSVSNTKSSFSTLNIQEIYNLGNTVFRLSYDPNVDASESVDKKTDHIIINKVTNSTDKPLTDYLQVFQNTQDFLIGDLSNKNIIVLSVANDSTTGSPNLKFNDKSSVQQGYDVISTVFETKKENSFNGDPAPAPVTPSSDAKDASDSLLSGATDTSVPSSSDASGSADSKSAVILPWTNYYIKSADVHIMKASQDMTQAAISSNYNIFLSNINDLNKRLGELRGNLDSQGAWGRIFNGMNITNRGEEVSTYSTNIQGGYDFSIPHNGARSYFGAALSYGYNVINGANFTGKAQNIELGAYYSFVSEEGFYTDTILKYAFITNKISLPQNQNTDNNLNSSTVSLGEEFGYRWNFLLKDLETSRHSLYLEPQAELIFGYIGDGSFNQINGGSYLNSNINSILAFRGRVGGVVGYTLKTTSNQTDFRLGISYVGDIAGGGEIQLKTNFSQAQESVSSNQMAMLSLGVNSILSKQWRVYADIDTSFLGKYYNQTYLISIGGRYTFGKPTLASESTKTKQLKENKESQKEAISNSAKLPSGYYWVIYAVKNDSKLTPKQEELIKKYPYKISYEYQNIQDVSGKSKKILFRYYLFGAFKTKEGAIKNQNVANQVTEILNNKKLKAILREIK